MSLCLHCGKIGEHAKGCPQAAPDAFDTAPAARNARTLKALEEVQAKVKEAKTLAASSPRDAAKLVFSLEQILEKHPSADLTSFEHKRNWKAAEDSLKAAKAEIAKGLGDKADQLMADLAFAKKALELLHAAQSRRREISVLSLDELTRVPDLHFDPKESQDPTDPSAQVRAACDALDKRLSATASVDADVDRWGKNYLEPLAAGESPRQFPSHMAAATKTPLAILGGGVVVSVFGVVLGLAVPSQKVAMPAVLGLGIVILGVGIVLYIKASSVVRNAPAEFAALSQRFRDRLYLVCVLRALRGLLSNLSKAEEALRNHTSGGEHAARWKRIKTQERDIVKSLCGEWDESRSVDDEMAKRIGGAIPGDAIRPARELSKDDWDGLAKAYQAERREDAEASDEMRLAVLAEVVRSRAGQQPDAIALRKRAITEARNAFTGRATAKLGSPRDL